MKKEKKEKKKKRRKKLDKDKDGKIALRKPLPWDTREISRTIDKFPSRRDEVLLESGL